MDAKTDNEMFVKKSYRSYCFYILKLVVNKIDLIGKFIRSKKKRECKPKINIGNVRKNKI